MDKKNVLFLCSWYPSKENESLGNFVVKHAECSSEVANVTVLYATSSANVEQITFEESEENKVNILRVYYPRNKVGIPILSQLSKLKAYRDALRKGFEKLDQQFDLVHLNVTFPAGLFALELKEKYELPYVLLSHWTGYLSHTKTFSDLPFYVKKIHKKIFKGANKVLVVSKHLGESLKELRLIDNYTVYPNVVEKKYFYPPESKESSEKLRILHVSSFNNEHKNIEGMLSAIAKLHRPYQLQLITESSEREVEEFLKKAGIPGEFAEIQSKCTPSEVGEAMRKNDLLVLFSNYETFSVVMAEAWMSGLPVVYSKCGGLTEVKDRDLGIQIEKKGAASLTNAIEGFNIRDYSTDRITEYAHQFEKNSLARVVAEIYKNIE